MAELKTKATKASVKEFIAKVPDEQMRKDSKVIIDMMTEATGVAPKMWGPSIIGFGDTKLKNPTTKKELDWFAMGFSPRKTNLVLYLSMSINEQAAALKKLGKHKTGVSCLYIKRLADVDLKVLRGMIDHAKMQ